MCELFKHEAYNSKIVRYKRQVLHCNAVSRVLCLSPLIQTMGYLKIVLLASALLLLTIVSAQEYFYEEYELEPDDISARTKRDTGDFILPRNHKQLGENHRLRRDEEIARHRRQGGHGNGGNGGGHEGITGPVHTFVKTDEHAHFKWGVRHHVGHEYAGRR